MDKYSSNLPIKPKISQRTLDVGQAVQWPSSTLNQNNPKKIRTSEKHPKSILASIQQTMRKPWPRPHVSAVLENSSAKGPERIQTGGS